MKRPLLVAALAAAVVTIGPVGATPTPSPAVLPYPQPRNYADLMPVRMEARAKMLDALSPGHRERIGQLFGDLAISSTPDTVATVKQIDALLSPQESHAIVKIAADTFAKTRTMFRPGPFGDPAMPTDYVRPILLQPDTDPGRILLTSVLGLVIPRPYTWHDPRLMH